MHWTEKIDPAYSPGDWIVRVAFGGSRIPGTVGQIADYGSNPNSYVVHFDDDGAEEWFDTTFRAAEPDEIPADAAGLEGDEPAPVEPYLEVLRDIAASLKDIASMSIAAHTRGVPVVDRRERSRQVAPDAIKRVREAKIRRMGGQ